MEKKENKNKQKKEKKNKQDNPMRTIKIEKVVLSIGGTTDYLEKGVKLLKLLTGKKPAKMKSKKRIPTWGVRPGLEIGTVVTLRKNTTEFLKRMLITIDNTLRKKQISENNFSFGIKEYIEIPGIEYQRDIGIRGFNVTVVFSRAGSRVKLKKIKRGKVPKKQHISKEEIMEYMKEVFKTKFK